MATMITAWSRKLIKVTGYIKYALWFIVRMHKKIIKFLQKLHALKIETRISLRMLLTFSNIYGKAAVT